VVTFSHQASDNNKGRKSAYPKHSEAEVKIPAKNTGKKKIFSPPEN